jgi:hypothetical protein
MQPPSPVYPKQSQGIPSWVGYAIGSLVVILIAIALIANATGKNIVTGELNLDVARVEKAISDSFSPLAVTVSCPHPMSGKPGDSRNCLVTAQDGSTVLEVVTIENNNGDVTFIPKR